MKRLNPRIGIIGFGAIAEEMVGSLETSGNMAALAGVLEQPSRLSLARDKCAGRFPLVSSIDALLALQPDVVVECAGHEAAMAYAPSILAKGVDLIVASVGALADRSFASRLADLARAGGSVLIPSGAVAGIDGLLAARAAGLARVAYTSIKGPGAWDGTPGAALLRGDARNRRTILFEGTAREAAISYPQNANVGATIGFAGLGLDRTTVQLVSDPSSTGPLGIIEAEGAFGRFRFEILAYASPANPKTSLITAHSLLLAGREGLCFRPFDRHPE
jgi:aspartate dehydrogenase